MKCQDCGGGVNTEIRVSLMTSCGGCGGQSQTANPCKECGRLHWKDGKTVSNRGGNPSFWEEGRIVIKNKKTGKILFRFKK